MFKRKSVILIVLGLVILATSCASLSKKAAITPIIPDKSILTPRFELRDKTFEAGTAFAVDVKEENVSLVLTAYHLFGEDGGLEAKIPPETLPDILKKVTFKDTYNDKTCGECDKVLKIADADTHAQKGK